MKCVWEHNGGDTLLYSVTCVGAYTRGSSLEAAAAKMKAELAAYAAWKGDGGEPYDGIDIVQEKSSELQIADADSDVFFDAEREPLTEPEYKALKALALKSARDFHALYASVPDKHVSCLPERTTFYGAVPRTAQEMYDHTRSVNSYYFAEIGVEVDHEGDIFACRERGFALLEQKVGFLNTGVTEGSWGESWSVRKVLRRFIWHDRIHAKAMYRMAVKTFGPGGAENVFRLPE